MDQLQLFNYAKLEHKQGGTECMKNNALVLR